jgi:hypothetical protein
LLSGDVSSAVFVFVIYYSRSCKVAANMVFSASTITALLLFVPFSAQQGSPPSPADGSHGVIGITCFDFGGTQFTNSTKCPGSNNCCPTIDLCQADGFCKGNNGTNIRPPCTKFPWDNTCSPLCRFGKLVVNDRSVWKHTYTISRGRNRFLAANEHMS